jgi:hypothetical protein
MCTFQVINKAFTCLQIRTHNDSKDMILKIYILNNKKNPMKNKFVKLFKKSSRINGILNFEQSRYYPHCERWFKSQSLIISLIVHNG